MTLTPPEVTITRRTKPPYDVRVYDCVVAPLYQVVLPSLRYCHWYVYVPVPPDGFAVHVLIVPAYTNPGPVMVTARVDAPTFTRCVSDPESPADVAVTRSSKSASDRLTLRE